MVLALEVIVPGVSKIGARGRSARGWTPSSPARPRHALTGDHARVLGLESLQSLTELLPPVLHVLQQSPVVRLGSIADDTAHNTVP